MAHHVDNAALDVEIVVPVYDEERSLACSIRRRHAYVSTQLNCSWQITIADNASTDLTGELADALGAELPGLAVLHLDRKGRARPRLVSEVMGGAGLVAAAFRAALPRPPPHGCRG